MTSRIVNSNTILKHFGRSLEGRQRRYYRSSRFLQSVCIIKDQEWPVWRHGGLSPSVHRFFIEICCVSRLRERGKSCHFPQWRSVCSPNYDAQQPTLGGCLHPGNVTCLFSRVFCFSLWPPLSTSDVHDSRFFFPNVVGDDQPFLDPLRVGAGPLRTYYYIRIIEVSKICKVENKSLDCPDIGDTCLSFYIAKKRLYRKILLGRMTFMDSNRPF